MARAPSLDEVLLWCRLAAWLICLGHMTPAVVRILMRRARYLDPIWGTVYLLGLNRLSYLFAVSPFWSNLTATGLALAMTWVSRGYLRDDRT